MRCQTLTLISVLLLLLFLPLASVYLFSISEKREGSTIQEKQDSKPTTWFIQYEGWSSCTNQRSILSPSKGERKNKETGYLLPYNEETDTTCSRSAREYWVKARANGDGKSEARPAGNLSYVLDLYNVTNSVIYVAPGVYNASTERFPLTITSNNVNILATGAVTHTIIESIIPDHSENGSGSCFNVSGTNVTIAGFTITHCWEGVLSWRGGISLIGNTFTESKEGVDLHGGNNIVTGNLFTNIEWFGLILTGLGFELGPGANNNVIRGNTFTHMRKGIEINFGGYTNTFDRNTIQDNTHGVELRNSKGCTFTGNNITGNKYGCWIECSSDNTFKGNNFLDNSEIGLYLLGSEWNLIYRNDFQGNEVNAKDTSGNNRFDWKHTGNYWDDYDGKDADGDGIGDKPYEIPGNGDSKDAYPVMHPFRVPERPSHRRDLWVTLAIGGGIGMGVVIIATMVYRHKKKQDQDDSERTPQPFRV